MPGKRNFNNKTFPNLLDKKIQFNEIPLKTVRVTIYALRWIFLLIFLFISIGIFVLFITGGPKEERTFSYYFSKKKKYKF